MPGTPQHSDTDTVMQAPVCTEVSEIIEDLLSGFGRYSLDVPSTQKSGQRTSPDPPTEKEGELCNQRIVLLSPSPNSLEIESPDFEDCSEALNELTQAQQSSTCNRVDRPEMATASRSNERNNASPLSGEKNVAPSCQGACLVARIVDVADQALRHGPNADIGQYLAGFGNHLMCTYPKCDVLDIARLELGINHNGKIYTKTREEGNGKADHLPCLKTKQGTEKSPHYADVLQVYPTLSLRAATAYGIVQQDQLPTHVPDVDVSPPVSNTVDSPQAGQDASLPSTLKAFNSQDQVSKQRPAYERRTALSKLQKKCTNCGTISAKYWRKHHDGSTACNACRSYWLRRKVERPQRLWTHRRGKRGTS